MKLAKKLGNKNIKLILMVALGGILLLLGSDYFFQKAQTKVEHSSAPTQPSTTSQSPQVKTITDSENIYSKAHFIYLTDLFTENFILYLQGELEKLNNQTDNICEVGFNFSKYSDVNIQGYKIQRTKDVSDERNVCNESAIIIWYLDGKNWKSINIERPLECDVVRKTTIAKEFIASCLEDNREVENPNGTTEQVLEFVNSERAADR